MISFFSFLISFSNWLSNSSVSEFNFFSLSYKILIFSLNSSSTSFFDFLNPIYSYFLIYSFLIRILASRFSFATLNFYS